MAIKIIKQSLHLINLFHLKPENQQQQQQKHQKEFNQAKHYFCLSLNIFKY